MLLKFIAFLLVTTLSACIALIVMLVYQNKEIAEIVKQEEILVEGDEAPGVSLIDRKGRSIE